MKKFLLALMLWCFAFQVQALDASVSFATFKGPTQNYVEVYLTIIGETVAYKTLDSLNYQAQVEVILLFKQADQIIKYDKYALNSPLTAKTINFIDLKRYGLENGEYQLEISLQDLIDKENIQSYKTDLVVDYGHEHILQSDIQLLSSFKKASDDDLNNPLVKNGYYLESLPFNFYNKKYAILSFYNEIYNTDKNLTEDFMVTYTIEKVKENASNKMILIGHKRRSPKANNVVLQQIDIKALESGNYRLLVEIRDRNKALLSQKSVYFQRSNPYLKDAPESEENFDIAETFTAQLSADELRYSLKALAPILEGINSERLNYIIKDADLEAQMKFLFAHWVTLHPNQPKIAYDRYMEVARAVDRHYKSGLGYGFETDRGHIFMKYGKPNEVLNISDEPDAPPYEIWSYNHVSRINQANVKFLFYNPSLAGGHYELLHSNARGELNNPQWQLTLYKDIPDQLNNSNYYDATGVVDGINRNAARYFRDN